MTRELLLYTATALTLMVASCQPATAQTSSSRQLSADVQSNVISGLEIVKPDSTCGTTQDIWNTLINGFGAQLNVITQESGLAVFYVPATQRNYVVVGNADFACLIASY